MQPYFGAFFVFLNHCKINQYAFIMFKNWKKKKKINDKKNVIFIKKHLAVFYIF